MQNIFINNLRMETQTVFCQNGHIHIYPSQYETRRHIVAGVGNASQKGRMVTDDSGTSHFRPYAKDSGSRYHTLFTTAHGQVKETQGSVIFELRFPKKLGKALMEALHKEETEEHQAWIKTRRSETLWRDENTCTPAKSEDEGVHYAFSEDEVEPFAY
jgi:hypothetical protein